MKKNYLKVIGSLLIAVLLIAGCKKELNETTRETDMQSEVSRERHGDECRLTSITSEFGDQTFKYNQRGLLDEWYISAYEGYFKQEYNARGRLSKSRFYKGNALVNTIIFFYHNDRVIKETWYNGDTKEKADEVFYHHDRRGLIQKSVSFMGDYYTSYTHTPEGNVLGWTFYVGGSPVYSSSYTYLPPHHKNPSLATPGVDYGFPSINGAYNQNKWYSTSEKDISYDEMGNPTAYNDQDPTKTIAKANRHNYVTISDFFDVLIQDYIHFRFEYDNCGPHDNDNTRTLQEQPIVNKSKINPLKFLRPGSAKSIKEQVAELRKQYRK